MGALAWTAEGRPAPELGAGFEAATSGLPDDPTDAELIDFAGGLASLLLLHNYDLDAGRVGQLLAQGFLDRGDGEGWSAAFREINDGAVRPALADVRRVRGSLPPDVEGGGAVVGLN